jgi:hypothetical protein
MEPVFEIFGPSSPCLEAGFEFTKFYSFGFNLRGYNKKVKLSLYRPWRLIGS